MKIHTLETFRVDLPFRTRFRHAAHTRRTSSSVFLRCRLDDGTVGYGECLPRPYVTGETSASVFDLLTTRVLPELLALDFHTYDDVTAFCAGLYDWLAGRVTGLPAHYGALCCIVELALLDAFGRHFGHGLHEASGGDALRYSGVISCDAPPKVLSLALAYRAMRMPALKLKVGTRWDLANARVCRLAAGSGVALRMDANGVWSLDQALEIVPRLMRLGVQPVEQPLPTDRLDDMRRLHEETGIDIIADESLRDLNDAECLIARGAVQGFNIRVSKCGGFFASLRIAELARRHGLTVQIGAQVGESAILSSVALALARRLDSVRFLEGFFGTHLLLEDVLPPGQNGRPIKLSFSRGGLPPDYRWQTGLGVPVDPAVIERHAVQHHRLQRA